MEQHLIIRRPLITEKGTMLRDAVQQYLFEVDTRANKQQIKGAIEKLFNVHVLGVKTLVMRGKYKRVGQQIGKKSNWKKAYITLKEGEKIEFFEGV
jgi:large subunit ribosomal protein L23